MTPSPPARSFHLALALFALLLGPATVPEVRGADSPAERYPPEHKETKELIALVSDAAGLVAEIGAFDACAHFRQPGSRWLQEETYVFILDLDGNSVCHPERPEYEGRAQLELRDPKGKPVVRGFLREVTGGDTEGWVHYLWPRPGTGTFYWKSSYVRRVEDPRGEDYVVGAGVYQLPMERSFVVEQVEDAADLLETLGTAAFETLRDPSSGYLFYDAYVFVMDHDGVQHVNAGFPENEGENLLELRDRDGKVIGKEILALVETRGRGWVDYLWPKPGDTRAAPKSTYVRGVEVDGVPMVVGAGVYLEE